MPSPKRTEPATAAAPATAPAPSFYRLTKAQHDKALLAAQGVTVGGAVYQVLANKLGPYAIGADVELNEAEILMLKDWGVSVRDAD